MSTLGAAFLDNRFPPPQPLLRTQNSRTKLAKKVCRDIGFQRIAAPPGGRVTCNRSRSPCLLKLAVNTIQISAALLQRVQQGEEQAVQALWVACHPQLVAFAQRKMKAIRDPMESGNDLAQSALQSFFRAAQQGRFPDLQNNEDLWRVLFSMTVRKAVDRIRKENRQKRGSGQRAGESVLDGGESESLAGLMNVAGDEPEPPFWVMMQEQVQLKMDLLGDPKLVATANARLEGHSNQEIADMQGVSVAAIERRLRLIRKKWSREQPGERQPES